MVVRYLCRHKRLELVPQVLWTDLEEVVDKLSSQLDLPID